MEGCTYFSELAEGPGQCSRSHAGKENKVGLGSWGGGRLWLHLPIEESREQCGSQGRCACCVRSGCGGVPPRNPARSLAGKPAHTELLFQTAGSTKQVPSPLGGSPAPVTADG